MQVVSRQFLTPYSRGALLAEQIMQKLSTNKVKNSLPFSKIKQNLTWAKFPVDMVEKYEDNMEKLAKARYESSRETSWVFQLDREEDDKYLEELNKATFEHAETSQFQGILSGIAKAADIISTVNGLITNYYDYRSVTYSEVSEYIEIFENSQDTALQFAAECLKAMTESGDTGLIAYLGSSWGVKYLAKKAEGSVYSTIQELLPPEWKYTIKAVCMANDLFLNTSSTIKVALDYSVVYEQLREYAGKLEGSTYLFAYDPVNYYDQFMKDKKVFMMALRLEFGYLQKLCEAVDDSLIQKFWIFVDEKNKHTFEGEKTFDLISNILDEAVVSCYNLSVGPYTN